MHLFIKKKNIIKLPQSVDNLGIQMIIKEKKCVSTHMEALQKAWVCGRVATLFGCIPELLLG